MQQFNCSIFIRVWLIMCHTSNWWVMGGSCKWGRHLRHHVLLKTQGETKHESWDGHIRLNVSFPADGKSMIRMSHAAPLVIHCCSPCTVLMQWTPEVPFLPLTTLSVAERNMYLVPPTVTPFMASSSVLAYRPSNVFSSSTDTWHSKQSVKFKLIKRQTWMLNAS